MTSEKITFCKACGDLEPFPIKGYCLNCFLKDPKLKEVWELANAIVGAVEIDLDIIYNPNLQSDSDIENRKIAQVPASCKRQIVRMLADFIDFVKPVKHK